MPTQGARPLAATAHTALSGGGRTRDDLQQRAFAGTVAPKMPKAAPAGT